MTDEHILFTHESATQDVEVAPDKKLRLDERSKDLANRAQDRQVACWMREARGCGGKPIVHVQEVGFDLRQVGARQRVAMVSSDDLTGPVPGFCVGCMATGPGLLAEVVYRTRLAMRMGFKPNRWFVRFTDGTAVDGSCEQIALHHAKPEYSDRPTSP